MYHEPKPKLDWGVKEFTPLEYDTEKFPSQHIISHVKIYVARRTAEFSAVLFDVLKTIGINQQNILLANFNGGKFSCVG